MYPIFHLRYINTRIIWRAYIYGNMKLFQNLQG
jgi:hypothetical protein